MDHRIAAEQRLGRGPRIAHVADNLDEVGVVAGAGENIPAVNV